MRRDRHIARQEELPLIEERARERMDLPPRGSLVRIAGAATNCNGVWKVASALRTPDGMFLGLAIPKFKRPAVVPKMCQEELFCLS